MFTRKNDTLSLWKIIKKQQKLTLLIYKYKLYLGIKEYEYLNISFKLRDMD